MGLSEELQEELDNMDARYAAVVRRLGEWQALGVDLLECRHDAPGMAECIHEAAVMLREDVCPSLAQPSPSAALREAQELNARMRQEVADMDAQRTAAERRAIEVQEANEFLRGEVELLRTRVETMVELERSVVEHVQSIAGAEVAPEPDQNDTETIPAAMEPVTLPTRKGMSPEARAAASERMKAMQARKRAAREAAAMPAPVEAVVVVEEIAAPVAVPVDVAVEPTKADAVAEPAPAPGVFDERTQACHARIVAEFAAGGHYTRDLESQLCADHFLTRHEVRAIADGVMSARQAAKVGKALKHCPECGGRFYADKGKEVALCRECRQIAAEVAEEVAAA